MEVGGLTLPDIKLSKVTVTKTVWHWWKNRQINQWNRIEGPEIDSYKYSQMIFDKGAEQYNGAKVVFSTHGAETAGHPHAKKNRKRKRPYTLDKN